jgi:hypothetical protein
MNALRVASVNALGRRGFTSEFTLEYTPASIDFSRHTTIQLKNAGWEDPVPSPDTAGPPGWSTITSNPLKPEAFAIDATEKHTGRYALRAAPARDVKTGRKYPFIVRSDAIQINAATDVIYSLWLKASHDNTPVDLALVDATFKGHGTYSERISVGPEWQRYELKCRLHNQLTSVWVGFKVYNGTVWADDATVAEVGK